MKREKGLTITQYNGIDIQQAHDIIKLHFQTYIKKIITIKSFDLTTTTNAPILMPSDNKVCTELESLISQIDPAAKMILETANGVIYQTNWQTHLCTCHLLSIYWFLGYKINAI